MTHQTRGLIGKFNMIKLIFFSNRHEVYELDETVRKGVGKLMDYYDLEFSACDFILRPNGEIVFLELNPNGQWLWLEYKTGFDLTDRFIDFLTN